MKKTIQYLLTLLFLTVCVSVSASSVILPDVLSLSRLGFTQQDDTVYVLEQNGFTSYLFAELPITKDRENDDDDKIIAEYSDKLEKSGWTKNKYLSSLEFEKVGAAGCELTLMLVNLQFANSILVTTTKQLPEGIYFYLIAPTTCNISLMHKTITAEFKHVETISQQSSETTKKPAE